MIGVLATAAQAVCCGAFVLLWRRLAHDPAILAFAVCSGLSALGFASFVVLHDGTTFDPASRLLLNLLNVAALTVGTWGLLRRSEVDVRFGIAVAIGAFGAATSATAILSAPESPSGLVCAYAVFAVLWAAGGTITAGRADGDGLRLAIGSVALLLAVVPLSTVALHHVLVGPATLATWTGSWWAAATGAQVLGSFAFTGLVMADCFRDVLQAERLRASVDRLSGVLTRAAFEDAASHAFGETDRPVCVVVADLDRFKGLNDTYGHAAGDAAIRAFGGVLARGVRAGDLVGRIGGEEFAVVLPNCRLADAARIAQKLRVRWATLDLRRESDAVPDGLRSTASFGVVERMESETLEEALARADALLYRAKRLGRDRVVADAERPVPSPAVRMRVAT